jgi:hypothetical protein
LCVCGCDGEGRRKVESSPVVFKEVLHLVYAHIHGLL